MFEMERCRRGAILRFLIDFLDRLALSPYSRFDIVVSSHGGSVIAEDYADRRLAQLLLNAGCGNVELDHADFLLNKDDISQVNSITELYHSFHCKLLFKKYLLF